jgi:hypothetical protein
VSVSAVQTDPAGNKSTADTTSFTLDATAPAAPGLTLGTGVTGGANQAEATQQSGVVTVTGETGATIVVSFTGVNNTGSPVTKTVTGQGSGTPVAVVLSLQNLTTLGDVAVNVSAIASDAAGNASTAGTTSFMLDAGIPAAPGLALGAGVTGGVTGGGVSQLKLVDGWGATQAPPADAWLLEALQPANTFVLLELKRPAEVIDQPKIDSFFIKAGSAPGSRQRTA